MSIQKRFKYLAFQLFAPGSLMRRKYEAFKALLDHDKGAHELMAQLEEFHYGHVAVDMCAVEATYHALSTSIRGLIDSLGRILPADQNDLDNVYRRFDSYIRFMLTSPRNATSPPYVLHMREIDEDNQELVGGKAMHLAQIQRRLDLPVPPGFVITANAFNLFIERNRLREAIDPLLAEMDPSSSFRSASEEIIRRVGRSRIPAEIAAAVERAVADARPSGRPLPRLAVRSSATSEDSHNSFAGQYDTVLDVSTADILTAYRRIIISKYSPGALFYRINCGLSDAETPMAVMVLEMVDADCSGVMYTRDPNNSGSRRMAIHTVPGLGEGLVDGRLTPDVIWLEGGDSPKIVGRRKGDRATDGEAILDDSAATTLGEWGRELVRLYGEDQDVEWCLDSQGQLFLLQSRALSTGELNLADGNACDLNGIDAEKLITGAERAAAGAGAGAVYLLEGENDLDQVPEGSVVVARHASPRYVSALNRAAAVVTETGSAAGHFASVAREYGVPLLVNAGNALKLLSPGSDVSVHADEGVVYKGLVEAIASGGCDRPERISGSPFARRLSSVMSFISPLRLVDPEAGSFKPMGCRSMHDIIRYCHETALRQMFRINDRRIRKLGGSKKLETGIPMQFLVLDVGGGLEAASDSGKTVDVNQIVCPALKAVVEGLSHPEIQWGDFSHFDWAEHDRIVMSGGIISPEAAMFASHVVVSEDYANMNLRFGYHFVIIDTICGEPAANNHILFRFSGGGADFTKRMLRADFLGTILQRLGFEVHRKSDLVDAELKAVDKERILEKLDMLGRLLGASRLMDMYLKDAAMVAAYADQFMQGRYHFSTTDL